MALYTVLMHGTMVLLGRPLPLPLVLLNAWLCKNDNHSPANQYTYKTRVRGVLLVSFWCGVFLHMYYTCFKRFTWCLIDVAYTYIRRVFVHEL